LYFAKPAAFITLLPLQSVRTDHNPANDAEAEVLFIFGFGQKPDGANRNCCMKLSLISCFFSVGSFAVFANKTAAA